MRPYAGMVALLVLALAGLEQQLAQLQRLQERAGGG